MEDMDKTNKNRFQKAFEAGAHELFDGLNTTLHIAGRKQEARINDDTFELFCTLDKNEEWILAVTASPDPDNKNKLHYEVHLRNGGEDFEEPVKVDVESDETADNEGNEKINKAVGTAIEETIGRFKNLIYKYRDDVEPERNRYSTSMKY